MTPKQNTADTTATLVDDIKAYVSRFVTVGADELHVIALWVLHTWTFGPEVPHPYTTPYLYIYSAEKRSGKTRLLEVLETIVRNPARVTDPSAAVLFRSIEIEQPTVMVDEADAVWSGAKNESLRGAINAGYKTGGKVPRIEKGEVRYFSVFAPKALAGIDNNMLPDTIRDRCLPIHMHRQPAGTSEQFFSWDVDTIAEPLRERIEKWVKTDYLKLSQDRPKAFAEVGDRAWEICMPLVQISKGFKSMYAPTKKALVTLLTQDDGREDPATRMLSTLREVWEANGNPASLPTALFLEALNGDDGGSGWNQKLLSNRLRPYGIKSKTIRYKQQVVRGFSRSDMQDAFARYLD